AWPITRCRARSSCSTNSPAAAPARFCVTNSRHASAPMGESSGGLERSDWGLTQSRRLRRPRPLLRAAVELVNALNGVRPLGRKGYKTIAGFWFGWPTSEVPALYVTASVLDAARRGRRGDFAGSRGKVALALRAAAWAGLAGLYPRH